MANYARVVLDKFDELLADLNKMRPQALAESAAQVVDDTVEEAYSSLIQAYPPAASNGTGNLRKGVKKSLKVTNGVVVGTVKSTAPHAHLWEFGTQVRSTREGFNRGAMPSQYGHGVVAVAVRKRREMRPKLIEQLTDKGLVVTDDGG